MASIFRSIRACALLFFTWCASIGSAIGYALGDLVERTFIDDLPPPILDPMASLAADEMARAAQAFEDEAEASRFKSYMDRSRSHDLYAGHGFAYG